MAATTTKRSLDGSFEAVELVVRDERERRAGEAAAVDADGTLAAEQLLAKRKRQRHVLVLNVPSRVQDAMPDSLT